MLQEFVVDSEVIVTSYPEIVKKSHAWRTSFLRVLRMLALMIDELDIPWDPRISSVFSRNDVPMSTICALFKLPSTIVDPSWKHISPPPPWFRSDKRMSIPRPPPWPG